MAIKRVIELRQVLLAPTEKMEVEIAETEEIVAVNWSSANGGCHQVWIARWTPRVRGEEGG